ncbi:MAG TPA: hypothetical protein DF383_01330 [Deltaproteobacteria bacterium]|nr:hypothetical protein [Deltaproteobacteria bacterium]
MAIQAGAVQDPSSNDGASQNEASQNEGQNDKSKEQAPLLPPLPESPMPTKLPKIHGLKDFEEPNATKTPGKS